MLVIAPRDQHALTSMLVSRSLTSILPLETTLTPEMTNTGSSCSSLPSRSARAAPPRGARGARCNLASRDAPRDRARPPGFFFG
eukprot:263613-Prymnesium_polylepis.1